MVENTDPSWLADLVIATSSYIWKPYPPSTQGLKTLSNTEWAPVEI
jgi:hypothetical protein